MPVHISFSNSSPFIENTNANTLVFIHISVWVVFFAGWHSQPIAIDFVAVSVGNDCD